MRLKLYRAPDVRTAMEAIRDELGPDALILATRRVAGGVELTAALDGSKGPVLEPPPLPDPARAALLQWHGIPEALRDKLSPGRGRLEAVLSKHLSFGAIDLEADAAPVLLTGPPGAGKTLTAARLATRLVMAGAAPLVITADGKRAGAAEQLAAFTRLLGLTLIVANHPLTLARALARRQDGQPVLIDAPGADPFDAAQRDEIIALTSTAGAQLVMVMPAGLDAAEAAEEAAAFADAGATLMVATRLDLTKRLGSVLAAAEAGRLLMAEAGISPGAADGLVALTPALLATRLARGSRGNTEHERPMDAA